MTRDGKAELKDEGKAKCVLNEHLLKAKGQDIEKNGTRCAPDRALSGVKTSTELSFF
jgi:hypothetical protein